MEAIKTAVDSIKGGQVVLARDLGISAQQVSEWVRGVRPVPAKYAIAIERAAKGKVTRHDLCPDVFGAAPARKPRKRVA